MLIAKKSTYLYDKMHLKKVVGQTVSLFYFYLHVTRNLLIPMKAYFNKIIFVTFRYITNTVLWLHFQN
jgi:hypothetical protein